MTAQLPTTWALVKVWLIYAAIGVVFAALLYMISGSNALPLVIATFAIFVAIGSIIVGTAAWSMFRARKGD